MKKVSIKFLVLCLFGLSSLGHSSPSKIAVIKSQTAYFAGGCFWGMEDLLRKIPGVISTEVGYMGGETKNATYEIVKTGTTQHAETVRVEFNPSKLTYSDLVLYFFKIHDPTTKNRQGNDVGTQYRSAIFYLTPEQKDDAERAIIRVDKSRAWKNPVVTQVVKAGDFWKAEEYHQKYLVKNPSGYTCHFERKFSF